MRYSIQILTISIYLFRCQGSIKKMPDLEHGIFYFNRLNTGDTLFLQLVKPYSPIRDWGLMKWEITEDSIFRFDDNGHYRYFGADKCRYSIKFDTLSLKYIRINGIDMTTKTKKEEEKFLVLESNKKCLKLVPIYDKNTNQQKIRTDIQLRQAL